MWYTQSDAGTRSFTTYSLQVFLETSHVNASNRNLDNDRKSVQRPNMACNTVSGLSKMGSPRMENTSHDPSSAIAHIANNQIHVGRTNNGTVLLGTSMAERSSHGSRNKHQLGSRGQTFPLYQQTTLPLPEASLGTARTLFQQPITTCHRGM